MDYRTGKMVKLRDSSAKVDKLFCITDDSHKWNNSQYETNIGLDVAKI